MGSLVAEHFRQATRLLRWGGVWYVAEATNTAKPDTCHMLLRPYFWYSLLCFSVWLATDVVAALWAVMYGSTRRGAFVSTVYLSTQIVVLIKTVLVWVALAFEARRLRRLIEKSASLRVQPWNYR
ncbi:hypothetical protein HPB48_010818 [Haemaphysalis longicornis]|uniref:Uncharacterized protein n=1 Tax=Haemaphysalis longicornis TaxID=44386 RepID=A0A9J6GTT4_HAELO|nr:hypothetical protein HPB48_010818 [Haemaphysalis longicornis]